MKAVLQTKFNSTTTRGNCMAASLASLFEIAMNEVPAFEEIKEWHQPFFEFIESHGYEYAGTKSFSSIKALCKFLKANKYGHKGWSPVSSKSPRNPNITHMVLVNGGGDIFDPHVSGDGVNGKVELWLIERI